MINLHESMGPGRDWTPYTVLKSGQKSYKKYAHVMLNCYVENYDENLEILINSFSMDHQDI